MRSVLAVAVVALIACAGSALAEEAAIQVVYKNKDTLELKSFEVGVEDAGLLGTSFKRLRKLPVKTKELQLQVPIENLARIEFLSVGEDGKAISLRLTALDGKTLEVAVDSESPLVWRGTVSFADSQVTLDPKEIKEIVLRPEPAKSK